MTNIWDTVVNEIQSVLELKDTITNAEHCKGLFSENKTQEPHLGWGSGGGWRVTDKNFPSENKSSGLCP